MIGGGWPEGTNSTEIEAIRQVIIQDMKILEALAPESGAYFNEVRASHIHTILQVLSHLVAHTQASRYEFDWKKSFFGSHYDKLRAIKKQYDPKSIFLVHEGVGSDEWDADLVCPV